jgi:hypothetical protein
MRWPKGYNPPDHEIEALTQKIMSTNAENMAYEQPATTQFYFINDCQRVILALTNKLHR